jgi:hypothetical protein
VTKEQRRKAMNRVIDACQKIKDKKPLAEAVRKIVDELRAQEKAHREAVAAEIAAKDSKPPV